VIDLVPVTFADACAFVDQHHRHHRRPVGHKFSIGVADADGILRGVIMVGRPVSRHQDDGETLEINRCATDGTKNANSKLYGAAVRAGFAMGYKRIITYTQEGECGASMKASGFRVLAVRPPLAGWSVPSRPRTTAYTSVQRYLWEAVRA